VVVAFGPSAWATSISLSDSTTWHPTAPTTPFDITSIGTTDWAIPGVDQKANASVISTYTVSSQLHLANWTSLWPGNGSTSTFHFSYTDGAAGSSTDAQSYYEYSTAATRPTNMFSADFALPQGDGTIVLWFNVNSACSFTLTATFQDGTAASWNQTNFKDTFVEGTFSYHSDTAQSLDMTFNLTNPTINMGIMGAAVAAVPTPEPGTLLLLSAGLVGLLCYAWRKRK